MPKFDVTDETVIDANPKIVYNAILDELAGVTHWSPPNVGYKLRGDLPIREGSIVDANIRDKGLTVKFSITVKKLVEYKSIDEELAGDFVGTGNWTFAPTDEKTKAQYRINAKTNTLLFSLFAPFINTGKSHSDLMQKGFKGCNSYLCKK